MADQTGKVPDTSLIFHFTQEAATPTLLFPEVRFDNVRIGEAVTFGTRFLTSQEHLNQPIGKPTVKFAATFTVTPLDEDAFGVIAGNLRGVPFPAGRRKPVPTVSAEVITGVLDAKQLRALGITVRVTEGQAEPFDAAEAANLSRRFEAARLADRAYYQSLGLLPPEVTGPGPSLPDLLTEVEDDVF